MSPHILDQNDVLIIISVHIPSPPMFSRHFQLEKETKRQLFGIQLIAAAVGAVLLHSIEQVVRKWPVDVTLLLTDRLATNVREQDVEIWLYSFYQMHRGDMLTVHTVFSVPTGKRVATSAVWALESDAQAKDKALKG